MRILNVNFGAVPAYAWGGPVTTIHENAREFVRRGHNVTVCASDLLAKSVRIGVDEQIIDGVRNLYLRTYVSKRWPGTVGPSMLSPSAIRLLAGEVRRADVVHLHSVRNALVFFALELAARYGRPLVVQPHGSHQQIVRTIWAKRIADKIASPRFFSKADAVLALTPTECRRLIAAGVDPSRIHMISNGRRLADALPASQRGRLRGVWGVAPDDVLVLFLARIEPKKGADLLVRAFAALPHDVRSRAKLVIAGPDDGDLNRVEGLVAAHAIGDRVIVPGLLDGIAVRQAHHDADVFALTCRTDTFPMALVEACQSGTAILTTETCEIAEILGPRAASVVSAEVPAIAAALCELICDASLRDRLGDGGQKLASGALSTEAVVRDLLAVYRSAITASEVSR